jgi:kojibiose phosphorylase
MQQQSSHDSMSGHHQCPYAWCITQDGFDPATQHHKETVFTIGNGYCGIRGSMEEGYPQDTPATMVAGIYDDVPLAHTELAAAPNPLPMAVYADNTRFRTDADGVEQVHRSLDMRTGMLHRSCRWRVNETAAIQVSFERFASMADPHLICIRLRVTSQGFSGTLSCSAGVNGYADTDGVVHWRSDEQKRLGDNGAWLSTHTLSSGIRLCEAYTVQVAGPAQPAWSYCDCDGIPTIVASMELHDAQQIVIDKFVSIYTSRDCEDPVSAACAHVHERSAEGFSAASEANAQQWEDIWARCNVHIDGDPEVEQGVRYSLFQLNIAGPRQDERVSIPVKTLSGFGYRNHVFWDADICMLPFFMYTQPEVARNCLMYRYHTLEGARRNAQKEGYEGAWFPWESAVTGDNVTADLVPHHYGEIVEIPYRLEEVHITADVAFAVMHYWKAAGDDAFMRDYGAEIVLDTARFLASRVTYNERQSRYEIHKVVGPDEYHWHVDNNAYTNAMARWNCAAALEVLQWLEGFDAHKKEQLCAQLHIDDDLLQRWEDMVQRMYIPCDAQSGLIEQFDGYFDLKDAVTADYEPRDVPLSVTLGLYGVMEYRLLKQADVIMYMALHADAYDRETVEKNWRFYEPRTDLTHGSSMAPPFYALAAAREGMVEEAYRNFSHAARTDLDNTKGDSEVAQHGSTLGGTWQALVLGFAGLRMDKDTWSTDPHLPAHWKKLTFTVTHKGKPVTIEVPNEDIPRESV